MYLCQWNSWIVIVGKRKKGSMYVISYKYNGKSDVGYVLGCNGSCGGG